MKLKKTLALGLALVMVFSLVTPLASASNNQFPDLVGHWGEADCREMVKEGLFIGYNNGNFGPNDLVTTTVALVLSARMLQLDALTKAAILEARLPEVEGIFGKNSDYSWAFLEFAICLETGIVSYDELKSLFDRGVLTSVDSSVNAISKQDLAMYMIRAMQLEPLALGQSNVTTSFADDSLVASTRKPYVYLMYMYGIVKGDENNKFDPYSSVNRAVMATMISRALKQMKSRGISVEVGEYTTYDYQVGLITKQELNSAGNVLLTLSDPLTAETTQLTFSPTTVAVYNNNMLGSTNDLRVGNLARVVYSSNKQISSVRLSGALTQYNGTVTSISSKSVSINVNGTAYTYPLNRFTEVRVGTTVGNRDIIAADGGYVSAVCYVDAHGKLAALDLTGGNRAEWGVLSKLETTGGTTYATVTAPNGIATRYSLRNVTVTVNGAKANITSSHISYHVALELDNEDGTLKSININTSQKYVIGALTRITTANSMVTVNNFINDKTEQYKINTYAPLSYNGTALSSTRDLVGNTYVTMLVSNNEALELITFTGKTEISGKLIELKYGEPISISVQENDGTIHSYSFATDELPAVTRDKTIVTFDNLRVGDWVDLTSYYQNLYSIDATTRDPDLEGTITLIVSAQTMSITVSLDNGEERTYSVPTSTPVTKDGESVSIYSLKYGDRIGLVLSGDTVSAITLKSSVVATPSVSGQIIYLGTLADNQRTMIIRDSVTGQDVQMVATSNTSVMTTAGGKLSISRIYVNDNVIVYYQIVNGTTEATLIIV